MKPRSDLTPFFRKNGKNVNAFWMMPNVRIIKKCSSHPYEWKRDLLAEKVVFDMFRRAKDRVVKMVQTPGFEPGQVAWKATILARLDHICRRGL